MCVQRGESYAGGRSTAMRPSCAWGLSATKLALVVLDVAASLPLGSSLTQGLYKAIMPLTGVLLSVHPSVMMAFRKQGPGSRDMYGLVDCCMMA